MVFIAVLLKLHEQRHGGRRILADKRAERRIAARTDGAACPDQRKRTRPIGGTLMSPRVKVDALKWSGSVLVAMMVLGASFAAGQTQDKELPGAFRYRVVRVPINVVEIEYTSEGRPRKPPMRPIHPLDDLSAEGWELVTVVQADGATVKTQGGAEAHGGDLICFLRKREAAPSSSPPGRR
jgi:hypothetical protein